MSQCSHQTVEPPHPSFHHRRASGSRPVSSSPDQNPPTTTHTDTHSALLAKPTSPTHPSSLSPRPCIANCGDEGRRSRNAHTPTIATRNPHGQRQMQTPVGSARPAFVALLTVGPRRAMLSVRTAVAVVVCGGVGLRGLMLYEPDLRAQTVLCCTYASGFRCD
ncbi:hypothetical protein BJ546DRAFT_597143 [Cryomyces antarcticus]